MDPFSVLGITASIIACVQLTGELLKRVKPSDHSSKDLNHILKIVCSFRGAYEGLKLRLEVNEEDEARLFAFQHLSGPLEDCNAALELLQTKLKYRHFFRRYILGGQWDRTLKKCLERLEDGKELFEVALSADHQVPLNAIERYARIAAEDVRDIKAAVDESRRLLLEHNEQSREHIKSMVVWHGEMGYQILDANRRLDELQQIERSQKEQELINWLSPLNFWVRQKDIFANRLEGTGEWILNTSLFQEWLNGTKRVLWCPGIPGAGKTTLSSVIVNHLEQSLKRQDVGVAYVYCNYKEQGQSASSLVSRILQQLVEQQHKISYNISVLHQTYLRKQTQPTLAERSSSLHLELRRFSKVFLLVDAMDECTETEGTRGIFLRELQRLPSNVQLLVTSRYNPNIERYFDGVPRLEILASDFDVKWYLESQILDQPRLASYVETDPSLKDAIIDTIVKQTNGMFLLAQIHIEALSRQDNRRDVRKTLLKLPEELNSTYDEAMARIRDQNSQKVKRAEQVLSWICYAFRPLKVKELQYALAIEPGDIVIDEEAVPDEGDLVAVCAGLVTIDMESKVIRLVHYTMQEYFDAKREYYFPDAHTDISRACITYLSMDCFSKTPCSEPDLLLEVNPLLNYAARFWMLHLRGEPERSNESLVLDFFQRPLNLNFSIQAWFSLNGIGFAFDGWFYGLWVAAHTGLEHVTQRLIEDNANIGSKNGSSMETALHAAARQGDERILTLLLEAGAAVNAKERHGDTALHFAAVAGHLAAVNVLIANNADIEATNSENRTPLHEAAFRGKKNVVRTLLDRGANATRRDSLGETALHRAAHNKKRTVIKLLLEKGVGLEKRDLKGRTALHCAVESGRELLARQLLTEGANIEAKDGRGATPLRKAVSCNDEDMAKLLLEAGADPNAKGYKGFSLLRVAVLSHRRREWRYGRRLESTMETLLLRHGAGPEAEFDGLPFRWDEDECLWLDVQSVSHTLVRHSSF